MEVQYKTRIGLLSHLINTHYIDVPHEMVQGLGGKINQRVWCTLNKLITFQAGLVALGKGCAYVSINNQRMKASGLKLGDEVEVTLKKDESKYGVEVPIEFTEVLQQDVEGERKFSQLSLSKQRYILQKIISIKSSQLRIDKAIKIIDMLKDGQIPTNGWF